MSFVFPSLHFIPSFAHSSSLFPSETGKICTPVKWVGLDYSDGPGTGWHITRACIAKSSQEDTPHPPPLALSGRAPVAHAVLLN
jgi:hypothetical protein